MKSYHLTPKGDQWELAEEGNGSIALFETKEDAVKTSTRTVEQITGSLKIHKADGTIEEERTYPRSADPAKSPG
ncbi:MAG TPA: DUF2188 domain-containing protein [Verrucomicrobiales bacterium]|nr:DUF2188 domain-containing protein [Verrucomicrobiales bacterium]